MNTTTPAKPWDHRWTTRDDRTLRVGDMDRQHRENTLAFLERHATALHARAFWAVPPPPEPWDDMMGAYQDELDRILALDPLVWLRTEHPAYVAIRAITPDGPGTSPRRWQNRRAAARLQNADALLRWLEDAAA